jgi:hypothetical protein
MARPKWNRRNGLIDFRPSGNARFLERHEHVFNLASYLDMKAHAAFIYDHIRGIGGVFMLPLAPWGEAIPSGMRG